MRKVEECQYGTSVLKWYFSALDATLRKTVRIRGTSRTAAIDPGSAFDAAEGSLSRAIIRKPSFLLSAQLLMV